ncbi:unnamed protein product [Cylindrotheca closterium]|uniref:Uncharacterized protein n=1 Tax=Cylindrotheca closterium TaxID=2856 RepID=A0AAD2CCE6_9STRA|nr:unnamed protein product [Cylindrotheca closterium]
MAAPTTMEAPLNEIEEESPPFAIEDESSSSSEKEQLTPENLVSSPTSSMASSQPIMSPLMATTSQNQSPIMLQQQQEQQIYSSNLSQSNSRILEASARIPTNTLLTTSPTFASNFTKLAPDSSLLVSQHHGDMGSVNTNSTSSMNSSSGSSSSQQLLPLTESDISQEHRMQASSTIMASSLFTVPLNSESTMAMSLQNSRHNPVASAGITTSHQLNNTSSSRAMGFSQLMQTADDTNLPAVPEDEAMDSFELFRAEEDQQEGAALILPATTHQIPNYSPQNPPQQQEQGNNQWFFNLLSAAKRRSGQAVTTTSNNQITILDASTSRLNTPLLVTPAPSTFFGGLDRARARVMTSLEDSRSFEVCMNFSASNNLHEQQQQQQQCTTVEDIMNIVSNPNNLQLWYDPIQTLVVTSRSNEDNDINSDGLGSGNGSAGSSGSSDRQYEGEWIEASTTALASPPCIVGPLYELESTLRESLGVGSYGLITIFVEKTHGKVTLTVGPFPGGIHVRHTISVSADERNHGSVKIVDRVKLETREEDASNFQNTLSLGGMLNSCLLPPLASYMEQVKNSMAKLLLLVESGQVSRSGGGGMVPPITR